MATGSNYLSTHIAKKVIGDNSTNTPGGALLQSGANRQDASPSGDTWLYYDTLGGTSSPWGIKHNQGNNDISFYGAGALSATIHLNKGINYLGGKLGIGTTAPGDYYLYVNGASYFNGNTTHNGIDYYANGTTYYINNSAEGNLLWLKLNRVSDHGLQVGTIRGMAVSSLTGEYIHMYERVHIGSPNGWGSRDAPQYGLSTYGGCRFNTDAGETIIGHTALDNTPFTTTLRLFHNESNESSNEVFTPTNSSWGITFQRQWSSGSTTTDAAGIYAVGSSSWGTGMVFRTKTHTSSTGAHDTNALWLSPIGYVGIGTISPDSQLTVGGQTKIHYDTPNLILKNTNASSYSIIRLWNSNADSGTVLFQNGPSRTADGGQNVFTIRNDVGPIRLDDTVYTTGTLYLGCPSGSYTEGIRLNAADGAWVTIALGATSGYGGTNTNANCWSIHRKSDNNFCISRNSSDGVNGLVMTSTGMGLGTAAPVARLTVNSSAVDSVGAIRVIDTRTDTGWHYPILCTSPSIANGGNVYICLGKACSTGNSAGLRWNHVADNSNDNLVGWEIWGVGTHLYTKRNTYSYATRMYSAVWNDYAEFRATKEEIEPGRCIKENGDGTLSLTEKRLEVGCEIVSDTYGFAIGQTKICNTPTAASGRVLAYPDKDPHTFIIGMPVCSGENGTISMMTEDEARLYPWCIIGTVSEIPTYDIWEAGNRTEIAGAQDIKVNNRIWIRIR